MLTGCRLVHQLHVCQWQWSTQSLVHVPKWSEAELVLPRSGLVSAVYSCPSSRGMEREQEGKEEREGRGGEGEGWERRDGREEERGERWHGRGRRREMAW